MRRNLLIAGVLALGFIGLKLSTRKAPRETPIPTPDVPASAVQPRAEPPPPSPPPPVPAVSPVYTEALEKAARLYAGERYGDAYREYRVAEGFGKLDAPTLARKESCYAALNLAEIRDALRQLEEPHRSWVTKSLADLAQIDPSKLPSDAWREEYRRTVKGLEAARSSGPPPRRP